MRTDPSPDGPVVEESADWLALCKPAGLPCFPPHAEPAGDCLLARLLVARPDHAAVAWPAGFEGGIAHRLDTPTSGLVLAARSVEALASLRAAFAGKALRKRYLLLTRRDVPWDRHILDLPLAHDPRRKARMTAQRGRSTAHRGRWLPAETALRRRGRVEGEGGPYHLWEATIRTGVMHQVRVHAAVAGLALAGDRLYGGGPPTPWALAHAPQAPPFHLHHLGLSGPDLAPRPLPVPAWWPALSEDL